MKKEQLKKIIKEQEIILDKFFEIQEYDETIDVEGLGDYEELDDEELKECEEYLNSEYYGLLCEYLDLKENILLQDGPFDEDIIYFKDDKDSLEYKYYTYEKIIKNIKKIKK